MNTFNSDALASLQHGLRQLNESVSKGESMIIGTSAGMRIYTLNALSQQAAKLRTSLSSELFENPQCVFSSLSDYLSYVRLKYDFDKVKLSDSEAIVIPDSLVDCTSEILSIADDFVEEVDDEIATSLKIARRDVKRGWTTSDTVQLICAVIEIILTLYSMFQPNIEAQEIIHNQETIISQQETLIALEEQKLSQSNLHNQDVDEMRQMLEDSLERWNCLLEDQLNRSDSSLIDPDSETSRPIE